MINRKTVELFILLFASLFIFASGIAVGYFLIPRSNNTPTVYNPPNVFPYYETTPTDKKSPVKYKSEGLDKFIYDIENVINKYEAEK